MIDAIKLRILQGDPVIRDVRNVTLPKLFRGLPKISDQVCPEGCDKCAAACPVNAISLNPLCIDLGVCTFCPLCEEVCEKKKIHFTNSYRLSSDKRENLIVTDRVESIAIEKATERIKYYFGRSLKLRQISAGGCNGCELELNALSNVNFDMGRFGIEFVASPRHADGIVITGPVTQNMSKALDICYEAVPNPKIIILAGTCAISGHLFKESPQIKRDFIERNNIDLYIPGCPPHPLTFIAGLLDWFKRKL